MNVSAILAELAKGAIRPAYLLSGAEPLLRDEVLAAISASVLGEGPRDFNLDRLDVGQSTPGRLEEALGSLPFMASQRLVVVREPEGRAGGGKLDARWTGVLEAWLGTARRDCGTVLVVITSKADKRSKWVKAFRDPAVLVECDAPTRARDLVAFLDEEASRQGVVLDADAADLLGERIGPQLLLLRQELQKAALLAGPGARIERKHVESSVASVAEESIWDLTDAIGQGRTHDAIDQLARLLAQGAAPPAILGALASHFRRLARVGHGETVGGPPFVVRKLEQQAKRYRSKRLVVCLRAIHRADVELKGAGILKPELALEQLILGLAG